MSASLDILFSRAYNIGMTSDAKISIDLLSPDPVTGKYVRRGNRHAVRFSSGDAIFRIETDGKSVKITKTAKVGYELVLSKSPGFTLRSAEGEFLMSDVRLHSLDFSETAEGFFLTAEYSLPPHDDNTVLRVTCEKYGA